MAEIIPAILTNDVSDFRKKYAELFAVSHLFSRLHIDFADGEFVPSLTLMPKDLLFLSAKGGSASGGKTPLALVAHFMTYNPEIFFHDAKKAGFKSVFFHYEAFINDSDLQHALDQAKELGLEPGLALNPETPLRKAAKFLSKFSAIQLMGITPGFQGRKFVPETIDKVKELRKLSKNVIIVVDGGVKVGIARLCVKAGADLIVAGSAIFKSEDEEMAIEALKADIEF